MPRTNLILAPLVMFLLSGIPLGRSVAADDSIPQGQIEGPFSIESEIFPGTLRDYWIYVPAQYNDDRPACLLVVQDGLNRANEWKLPSVMDQLIHQGKMPVTLGVFVNPGTVPAPSPKMQPRFNRSFEYDALGDRYAEFLLEELLPDVARKGYSVSQDPNDRAIAGASSGGICAFTVAWERPDQFRRVLSTIGTYVGLRGGDIYPTLIRKMEPKPIRVFLQDGSHDLNIYGGDWWIANQSMLSALKFAGYEVRHAWGAGGHDGQHAAEIMPEAMAWLWQNHPQPIANDAAAAERRRTNLLIPGEAWELVSEGHQFTEGPAINGAGEVFFSDIQHDRIHKISPDGTVSLFVDSSPKVNGLMFGSDGFLYACQNGTQRIVRYDAAGNEEVILSNAPSNDLIVWGDGGFYTEPQAGKVWYVNGQGERTLATDLVPFPNGIITSPDRHLLLVSDTRGRFIYSFQIQPDGSLAHGQPYGYLHLPDDTGESGADGMTMDTEGRLYVTTRLGVQVLDQLGRVQFIIAKPQNAWLSNVVFAGPDLNILYATSSDKVYRRKLNATGVIPWKDAIEIPRPRL